MGKIFSKIRIIGLVIVSLFILKRANADPVNTNTTDRINKVRLSVSEKMKNPDHQSVEFIKTFGNPTLAQWLNWPNWGNWNNWVNWNNWNNWFNWFNY